jgi:hypothetical protein
MCILQFAAFYWQRLLAKSSMVHRACYCSGCLMSCQVRSTNTTQHSGCSAAFHSRGPGCCGGDSTERHCLLNQALLPT